jgi:hypothetical protein
MLTLMILVQLKEIFISIHRVCLLAKLIIQYYFPPLLLLLCFSANIIPRFLSFHHPHYKYQGQGEIRSGKGKTRKYPQESGMSHFNLQGHLHLLIVS